MDLTDYTAAIFSCAYANGKINYTDYETTDYYSAGLSPTIYQMFAISLDDYNRLMDENVELDDDEAIVCFTKGMGSAKNVSPDELVLGDDGPHYKVKNIIGRFIANGTEAYNVLPGIVKVLSLFQLIR